MIEQRWTPVPGYEGLYEIAADGAIRGARRQGTKGAHLRPSIDARGYHKVSLYNGKRRAFWVHRLVLEAFAGPAPEGAIACHNNGNPRDNRLENLRWGTPAENYEDARRHGTAAIGPRNASTKISASVRAAIQKMRQAGSLQREIAAEFGLSQQHVSAILAEKSQ